MTEVKKPRRSRVDSTASARIDLQAAGRVIEPPADMLFKARDRVIFDEIIAEVPKSEWSLHAIRMAALLARSMRMLEAEQDRLTEEGSVITAANGSPIGNPRTRAVDGLSRIILATRRTLSLTARAKAGGDNRVLGQRRAIQMGNQTVLDDIDDEGLLARPPAFITNPRKDN